MSNYSLCFSKLGDTVAEFSLMCNDKRTKVPNLPSDIQSIWIQCDAQGFVNTEA